MHMLPFNHLCYLFFFWTDVLLGYTLVALCSPGREMSRRHVYPLTPSPVLPKTTVQAISVEVRNAKQ